MFLVFLSRFFTLDANAIGPITCENLTTLINTNTAILKQQINTNTAILEKILANLDRGNYRNPHLFHFKLSSLRFYLHLGQNIGKNRDAYTTVMSSTF